jgi:hypothetical protein
MGPHFVTTHRNGAVFHSFVIPSCNYVIKQVCVALKMPSAPSKFHFFFFFCKLVELKEKDTKGESKAIPLEVIAVLRA